MKAKLLIVGMSGLGISLVLGAALYFVSWTNAQSKASQPFTEESKKLPNFILPDLNGETHSVSGLAGKAALINFWATWCSPCEAEMPLLQSYAAKYPDINFIGVNSGEDPSVIEPFIDKYDITFPIWLDADEEVTEKLQIIGLPTTYFIDSAGNIQAMHLGQLSPELLDQYLSKLGTEP